MADDRPHDAPVESSWLELLHRALNGDGEAEGRLLVEIRQYLKGEVEKLCGRQPLGPADASDVAQECLLAIWQHAQAVRAMTEAEVRAWVRAIAHNGFLNAVRRAHQPGRDVDRQVPLPHDSGGAVMVAAGTSSPSHQAASHEEEERRQRALGRLPPADQQVLRLRYVEGRDWPDVAREMGRSLEAVKRLFYRAVQRWKDEVGDVP